MDIKKKKKKNTQNSTLYIIRQETKFENKKKILCIYRHTLGHVPNLKFKFETSLAGPRVWCV